MKPDPTSLDRLHDIVAPGPVPLWPPAPGWLFLLALLSVLVFAGLVRAFAHRQRNRYRREALSRLHRLERASHGGGRTDEVLLGLSELLKRVAVTSYPRAQVAALTGDEWFAFLDRTGRTRFAGGLGQALEQSNYGGRVGGWDTARVRELAAEVGHWIRRHHGAAP